MTISAGVCAIENAHDADTLVRDADRALYRAKDAGRNMTAIYTDTQEIVDNDGKELRATVAGLFVR